jgi:hypothetical protein
MDLDDAEAIDDPPDQRPRQGQMAPVSAVDGGLGEAAEQDAEALGEGWGYVGHGVLLVKMTEKVK